MLPLLASPTSCGSESALCGPVGTRDSRRAETPQLRSCDADPRRLLDGDATETVTRRWAPSKLVTPNTFRDRRPANRRNRPAGMPISIEPIATPSTACRARDKTLRVSPAAPTTRPSRATRSTHTSRGDSSVTTRIFPAAPLPVPPSVPTVLRSTTLIACKLAVSPDL